MFREEAFIQVKRRMVRDVDLNDMGRKKEMDGARDVNFGSSAIVLPVGKKGSVIETVFVLGNGREEYFTSCCVDCQHDPLIHPFFRGYPLRYSSSRHELTSPFTPQLTTHPSLTSQNCNSTSSTKITILREQEAVQVC